MRPATTSYVERKPRGMSGQKRPALLNTLSGGRENRKQCIHWTLPSKPADLHKPASCTISTLAYSNI